MGRARVGLHALPLAFAILCASTDCAAPPPACPCASPSPAVPAVVAIAAPEAKPASAPALASPPPARESPCWARGRPSVAALAATLLKKDDHPFCAGLDSREVASLEARVRKDFVVHEKPSKLIVDFGCDIAFGTLRDLFFEDGSGHGGSLRIVHFRREPGRVVVRMVDYAHYQNKHLDVRTADVDQKSFDAVVASARVAMLVRPHLIRLVEPNNFTGSGGASSSSNDFHRRISIVDEKDRITDGRFSGYESSREQERILPMRYASEPLQKLIAAAPFVKTPATDEDKKIFTERLAITLGGEPFWWVKERYVAVAAHLGTVDALPALTALLAASVAAKGGASEDRARDAVIEAIAAITGWDPRVDPFGTARTPEQAAAVAIAECAP